MELGSLFLLLALLILVGLVISRPFLTGRQLAHPKSLSNPADHERSALLAERDQVLRTLKDLDFDFALGKIPAEDYPSQRSLLLKKGANVLRRLDQIIPPEAQLSAEAQLEAAIASHRIEMSDLSHAPNGNGRKSSSWIASAVVAAPDDELEVMLANRRRARRDKATGFCPKCGAPHQQSDRYCPKCGAMVKPA